MFTFCLWFQSVGQVHSEDADEGINGDIYYSLMDPKSSFAVDPVTGVISLTRPLSYQKKPRHEISVVAQDRGAKSRFATRAPDTATVHLSVRQVRIFVPFVWKDFSRCEKLHGRKKWSLRGQREWDEVARKKFVFDFFALDFFIFSQNEPRSKLLWS